MVSVKDTQDQVTAQQEMWEASAAKHEAKKREGHRLAWIDHYTGMYRSHSKLASRYAHLAMELEDASVAGIGAGQKQGFEAIGKSHRLPTGEGTC